ncbi:MAG: hypothetical protein ACFCVK_16850 [Acidimicrobiales bacterium]
MITVVPETYTKVEYDVGELRECAERALGRIPSLADGLDVEIRIDEMQATTRLWIVSLDPLVFELDSGAVENLRDPRRLGHLEAEVAFSRLFLELTDRWSDAFGAPALGADVSHAHRMAWDVNLYGRVGRLGLRLHTPRFRYNFRNRHGFSDLADRVFDRLWEADGLTWAQIVALSDEAIDHLVVDN